mgnify:CR=1 FL=1
MGKLTRQEAREILLEAQRLKKLYKDGKPRFGQAIWWCCSGHSNLSDDLKDKLSIILEDTRATGYDIFYWEDDVEVIRWVYEVYVEQY